MKSLPSLPEPPFLYPILDSMFSDDLVRDAHDAVRAGVRIFQLRAKGWTKRQILQIVEELSPACLEKRVCMIVNDHVDIVMASQASGVHLGQADFPVQDCRNVLPDRIIGVSTHNLQQFSAATKSAVDYIAAGPIYRTSTKLGADPPLGPAFVADVRSQTKLPLVCIGGIQKLHLRELLDAGADGIALISELYKGASIYDTTSTLLEAMHR